jgi:hypothetical protein
VRRRILGAFRKPVGVKPWLGHPKYIKIKCQVVRIFGLLKNAQNRGWDGHNYYLSNDPLVMWFRWEMSEIQQKYIAFPTLYYAFQRPNPTISVCYFHRLWPYAFATLGTFSVHSLRFPTLDYTIFATLCYTLVHFLHFLRPNPTLLVHYFRRLWPKPFLHFVRRWL